MWLVMLIFAVSWDLSSPVTYVYRTDSTGVHYGEVKRNSTTYRARTRGDMVTDENARELGKLLALRLRAALSQESGNT